MVRFSTLQEVLEEVFMKGGAYEDMKLLSIEQDKNEFIFKLESRDGVHSRELRVSRYKKY